LLAECAVGINSHGKDWEEFHQYVLKFGEERIIGGDYGKYDQKLPSQLLFASLRVLIDLAAAAGYSEEDIYIMKMMTTDIVYALVAFNGDLISLNCGGHISGNSLTVILNSISGSLNLRCYFFSNYDSEFREAVALSTYGDDNIGSVKEGFDNFNIKGASEFLGKYGQTYTMPDKNSELTAYLPYEQFEFLKRKSVFHPKLNRHIGALVPGSIFKSLHCCLRRKGHPLTGQELSALNVDTALREWFNHGEEIYEQRRKELKEIALKTDIEHMCLGLDLTYDERVIDWEDRYIRKIKPEYVSNTDDDVSDLE